LNCGVGQSCRRRCSMPVFFPGWEPNDVSWPDLLDGTALALHPAASRSDDQSLAERVRMPGSAGAWLERDAADTYPSRIRCLEQRVNPDTSSEVFSRSLARWLRAIAPDLHCSGPSFGQFG